MHSDMNTHKLLTFWRAYTSCACLVRDWYLVEISEAGDDSCIKFSALDVTLSIMGSKLTMSWTMVFVARRACFLSPIEAELIPGVG